MVASSRCGVFSNRSIFRSPLRSLSSSSFIVCGSSENNATSDAEITAEKPNNKALVRSETMADNVTGWTVMPPNIE